MDGYVDSVNCDTTETIAASSVISASQFSIDDPGDFTGAAMGADATDLVTGSVTSFTIPFGTEATALDTSDDSGTFSITVFNPVTFELDDLDGNGFVPDADAPLSPVGGFTDGAAPVFYSSYPEDGDTGVGRTSIIRLVMSELIDNTADFIYDTQWSISDAGGSLDSSAYGISASFSDDTDNNRTTVSILHRSFDRGADLTLSLQAGSLPDLTGNGLDALNEIGFNISSSSGGSSGGSSGFATSTTPIVSLTEPTVGDELVAGDTATIGWTYSGSGIDTMKLEYSTDGGSTYKSIADNVDKSDLSYDWTVPDVMSDEVIVKITAQDSGKAYLDTDTSGMISIAAAEDQTESQQQSDSDAGITTDKEGRRWAPSSGEMGLSPFDGSEEEISQVSAGWYVRSENYNTVYYVEDGSVRRVFWDAQTFFTYADSWDDVVWVTDATLATLDMGAPMLPKAGVVLVKVQSDPSVYATEDSGSDVLLRYVPSEEVASALYGSDWADYVIDVEPTILSHYATGDAMDGTEDVDVSSMRTRAYLAELQGN